MCVCCVGKCATVLIWRSEKKFCGREWTCSKYNSFMDVWNYKKINELKNEIQEWAPTECVCVQAWMCMHVCVLHTQKQLSSFSVALTHVCRDVNLGLASLSVICSLRKLILPFSSTIDCLYFCILMDEAMKNSSHSHWQASWGCYCADPV